MLAVINPVQQVSNLLGVTLAGRLASTALHGFHATVGGLEFGRIDTVMAVGGLLVVAGGLYAGPAGEGAPVPAPAVE